MLFNKFSQNKPSFMDPRRGIGIAQDNMNPMMPIPMMDARRGTGILPQNQGQMMPGQTGSGRPGINIPAINRFTLFR